MLFTSVEFFAFLGLVLLLMKALRRERSRRYVLLFASYLFYAWWNWRYCFLLMTSTAIDYVAALRIESSSGRSERRAWLILSLATNLGLLASFKYSGFLAESIAPVLDLLDLKAPSFDLLLPVGISFFTFQSMSYTIDVYRGRLATTRNLSEFALYVSFFPQLVAGPIVRAAHFLPQFEKDHSLRAENLRTGLEIFVRGLVKKALFADTLAIMVDHVFAHPSAFSGPTCWFAIVAYGGQIYYDFSGYTDMAIGVAKMLGWDLPVNFEHPYLARSITEFWRRWHISLSSWLRDYLYIPLGGNRAGRAKTYANLMVTMLLGGLWHGAAWTFVVWGGLHGLALAAERIWRSRAGYRGPSNRTDLVVLSRLATLLFVLLTWVFFRAPDFATAGLFLRKLAFLEAGGADWFYFDAVVVTLLGVLLHWYSWSRNESSLALDLRRPLGLVGLIAVAVVLLLRVPLGHTPFIYFQF